MADAKDWVDAEIARRGVRAQKLAARFPELAACHDYAEFLSKSIDLGLELDFITSCQLWEALQGKAGE